MSDSQEKLKIFNEDIKRIAALCQQISVFEPDVSDAAGKSYEVREYLSEVHRVQAVHGGEFLYADNTRPIKRNGLAEITLRSRPGELEPFGENNYTHFSYFDGSDQFEVHLSLQVAGRSRAGHELDISVISACSRIADTICGHTLYTRCVARAVECKDYRTSRKGVGKHLCRSFALTKIDHDISVAIFRTGGFISDNSQRLLDHYQVIVEQTD